MSLQFVRESAMPAASPTAPLAMLVRAPEPEEEDDGAELTVLNSARQAAASRRAVMVTVGQLQNPGPAGHRNSIVYIFTGNNILFQDSFETHFT